MAIAVIVNLICSSTKGNCYCEPDLQSPIYGLSFPPHEVRDDNLFQDGSRVMFWLL